MTQKEAPLPGARSTTDSPGNSRWRRSCEIQRQPPRHDSHFPQSRGQSLPSGTEGLGSRGSQLSQGHGDSWCVCAGVKGRKPTGPQGVGRGAASLTTVATRLMKATGLEAAPAPTRENNESSVARPRAGCRENAGPHAQGHGEPRAMQLHPHGVQEQGKATCRARGRAGAAHRKCSLGRGQGSEGQRGPC